jgi:hypothetical protein
MKECCICLDRFGLIVHDCVNPLPEQALDLLEQALDLLEPALKLPLAAQGVLYPLPAWRNEFYPQS